MEKAAVEEKGRKNGSFDPIRKRPPSAPAEDPSDAKRQKLEPDVAVASSSTPAASLLAAVDFTQIPVSLITDLVVANLQAFSEPALNELVQIYRQSKIIAASTLTAVPPVALQSTSIVAPSARPPEPESSISVVRVKEEPVDPLQMDIDEEEFDFEPDTLNQKVRILVTLIGSVDDVLFSSQRMGKWTPRWMRKQILRSLEVVR
jgi:symplekin